MMKIFRIFWKKIQKMWKQVLQNPISKLVPCHKKEVQKSEKTLGKTALHRFDLRENMRTSHSISKEELQAEG